jgi:hypothetical protein
VRQRSPGCCFAGDSNRKENKYGNPYFRVRRGTQSLQI